MSLSRRLSTIFATFFGAAALVVAGLQAAVPQAPRGKGASALVDGQELVFRSPQFVVHALWFKSNDETNWKYGGSDEVYAIFSDMNPTHSDRATSVYGDVDEGETKNFLAVDKCMSPQPACDRGTAELNVRFSFWERDALPLGLEWCWGEIAGGHTWLEKGLCTSDDLIGRGEIIYSRDELRAMLPTVGDSREFTAVMDQDAGIYRFRYKITRLPDIERSIVIHLPPLDPRSITLQATPILVSGQKAVRLLWTGATTSTVDIYRNGANVITTPNDGAHNDLVPPGTYQYRVCDLGSTTACSANVTAVVP